MQFWSSLTRTTHYKGEVSDNCSTTWRKAQCRFAQLFLLLQFCDTKWRAFFTCQLIHDQRSGEGLNYFFCTKRIVQLNTCLQSKVEQCSVLAGCNCGSCERQSMQCILCSVKLCKVCSSMKYTVLCSFAKQYIAVQLQRCRQDTLVGPVKGRQCQVLQSMQYSAV